MVPVPALAATAGHQVGAMTGVAQYAINAMDNAMAANHMGEIPGLGPVWACEEFGAPGHNYGICAECWKRFNAHFDAREATA